MTPAGLITQIERKKTKESDVLTYAPESSKTLPVARSIRGGAWTLDAITVWEGSQPDRFTSDAVFKRSKTFIAKYPIRSTVDSKNPDTLANANQALANSKFGSSDALTRWRFPLIGAGVILLALGIFAYVRNRS